MSSGLKSEPAIEKVLREGDGPTVDITHVTIGAIPHSKVPVSAGILGAHAY